MIVCVMHVSMRGRVDSLSSNHAYVHVYSIHMNMSWDLRYELWSVIMIHYLSEIYVHVHEPHVYMSVYVCLYNMIAVQHLDNIFWELFYENLRLRIRFRCFYLFSCWAELFPLYLLYRLSEYEYELIYYVYSKIRRGVFVLRVNTQHNRF